MRRLTIGEIAYALVVAAIATTLATPVFFLLAHVAVQLTSYQSPQMPNLASLLVLGVAALVPALAAALPIGLPVLLVLRRTKQLGKVQIVTAAAAIGFLIPALVVYWLGLNPRTKEGGPLLVAVGGLVGTVAGLVVSWKLAAITRKASSAQDVA